MRSVLLISAAFGLAALACKKPPPAELTPRPSPSSIATADDGPVAAPPSLVDAADAADLGDTSLLATLGAANAEGDAAAIAEDANAPRQWRQIKGRHWQIVSPPGEPSDVTDLAEHNRGACSPGMIEIAGNMVNAYMMDERQQGVCTKWINRNFPERCAEFDRDRWLAQIRDLPRRPMHFCIDRFEYPNKKGEYPVLYVNWVEANTLCEEDGKRLCSETEWTFACEGEEATPYPYGYVRDAEACIVDKTWVPYYPKAFSTDEGTMHELDRLWQGAASGARPRCKSPFGVYDMIGNVDEWTRSSAPQGRPSVLKGGYWGPVRTRCRPSTRAHGELHAFYQQGFRCCANLESVEAGAEAGVKERDL
jgi:sulfatase modifying factor 1